MRLFREIENDGRRRGGSASSCCCSCCWEEENEEPKAESGIERVFVSWLSGCSWYWDWGSSAPGPGSWEGEREGEREGEGEGDSVGGRLCISPSPLLSSSAWLISFLGGNKSSNKPSSSSVGHEDGKGARWVFASERLERKKYHARRISLRLVRSVSVFLSGTVTGSFGLGLG